MDAIKHTPPNVAAAHQRTARRSPIGSGTRLAVSCCVLMAGAAGVAAEPRVFQAGALELTPLLRLDINQDDNIYRRDADEQDSLITLLTPRLEALYRAGVNQFAVNLEATRGDFSATDEDDFTTWNLGGTAHLELNDFNLLDLSASFEDGIQRRGTGFSQFGPLPDEPDAFERTALAVTYQLGSQASRARVRLGATSNAMEYTNNLQFATGRDYDQSGLQATLLFSLSPRTDLLFEARSGEFEYDRPLTASGQAVSALLDSSEQYVFVGASWEATARTSGSVRIGRAKKDFDSPSRPDVDGPSYEIDVQYALRTYSTLGLSAQQNYGEGIGVGNAVERTVLGVNWQHDWQNSLTSQVSLQREDSDYVGSPLTDKVNRFSANASYALRRWLGLRLGISLEDRDTNVQQAFGYDQTVLILGFDASF